MDATMDLSAAYPAGGSIAWPRPAHSGSLSRLSGGGLDYADRSLIHASLTLRSQVRVTRDGKPRSVSTQEAALLRLREKALAGDVRSLDRLISLAQAYNNEEATAPAALSDDDAALVELFAERVLSGAAGSTVTDIDVEDGGDR